LLFLFRITNKKRTHEETISAAGLAKTKGNQAEVIIKGEEDFSMVR